MNAFGGAKAMRVSGALGICQDVTPRRRVPLGARTMVGVHRCGLGASAAAIAEAFRTVDGAYQATSGRMPYAFVVAPDGLIEQAALVVEVTPHVRGWNEACIGVCLIGDMRYEPPTSVQLRAAQWLCARLAALVGGPSKVWGHDELSGASADTGKRCPGRQLNMPAFRELVGREMPSVAHGWAIRVD